MIGRCVPSSGNVDDSIETHVFDYTIDKYEKTYFKEAKIFLED